MYYYVLQLVFTCCRDLFGKEPKKEPYVGEDAVSIVALHETVCDTTLMTHTILQRIPS